jgi:hypothetical protein
VAVAKAALALAAVATLVGCTADQDPAAVPPPAAAIQRGACHLLTDKQVRTALAGDIKSTEELSSAANPLSCRYLGQGDAYLKIDAHRLSDVDDAKGELAAKRKTCPTAVALDVSGMDVYTVTGLTCPATPTGGSAIAWAEWHTIVLQVDLRPGGERNAASTGHQLRSTTSQIQHNLKIDSF